MEQTEHEYLVELLDLDWTFFARKYFGDLYE
jgi:hypothetical protein